MRKGSTGRISGYAAACLLAFLLLAGAFPGSAFQETLRIAGTGGAIGGLARVAKAFQEENPGIDVAVLDTMGSTGGIRAVIAGKVDIGLSARPLLPAERSMGGQETPYARTAFVFAVNEGVSRSGITLSEAADLYRGKIDRWEDGTPVRPVLRHLPDTDAVELERISPELGEAYGKAIRRDGMIFARTDKACADRIENTPGAFGTTTLSLVISEKRRIKVLSVGDRTPSVQGVRDGSYPYTKTFRLVTGPSYSTAVAKFKRFLRSPKGRSILLEAGQVELP